MVLPLAGVLLFGLVAFSSCDLGDSCGKGSSGKCILVSHCKSAVEALKKGRHHLLERCGFQGDEEIVCCQESDLGLRNPDKIRKSVVACNSFKDAFVITPFIIGGENASVGEFPHMAALGYEDETSNEYNFECGGSLISENYVLTAGHCLVRIDEKLPKIVRLGKVDLFGDTDGVKAQDINVADVFVHESYGWKDKINDIGLVKLEKPVDMDGNVKPICLYTDDDEPRKLVVAGFGKIGNTRDGSRFLLKTYLAPVALKECNKTLGTRAFAKPVFETQMCAKSRDTIARDTCEGDSGGPMQNEESGQNGTLTLASLVGITSYGPLCGSNLPSIYTRVSKYLDWIEKMVWP